ncbi:hypothetical protein [Erythrobacter sp. AP23]|uniref:hypothetical protein n=1 Tax=Erythrobacter sp. AP23 TaxID=499656 RepID=UPI00076C21B9|nr:hypothetical protein [Erythrobacter sp. AP23]KWV96158.1 hypothetical protein ASS64_02795 [Erythrobacter sp. AP23]
MTKLKTTALASALTLAIAACGEAEEPVVDNDLADEQVIDTAEYDPMTRDYLLSDDAAERRAEFSEPDFRSEYRTYRDEIVSEQVRLVNEAGDDADMSETDREEAEAAAQPREANTNMRARENMTWGYLDRNDDDQLSVAEYAIWAIPLNPQNEALNDQGQPELKADTINKAADSFFYYDLDGDTYLDRREFTAARRGENFDL